MKPFFSFQWHITDRCDQRCQHCYIFSDQKKHQDEMSLNEMKNTLEKCLNFCEHFDRTPYFFITGGDPIVHPNFWDLVALLKEKNVGFAILGNPFHLTSDVCRKLKEAGCDSYQLSIDGLEKTHDWFRKPGSFQSTLKAIPLLKEAEIEVDIMTTLSEINKDELLEVIDTVVENKADLFSFARFCPGEKGKSNGLGPEEYRSILKSVYNKVCDLEKEGCSTIISKKDHLWTLLDFEEGRFKIPEDIDPELIYEGCNCGNAHLTIIPNGDILACRRVANSKTGNILSDDLIKIWLEDMESYREFKMFEKCSKCELLAWCRGCPAVASAEENGFYSSDPQCWKVVKEL